MERCAGLDWAKDAHRMCVLEGDGEPLLQRGFTHDERDLDGMCELLLESEALQRVAIERPDGVVVERLLQAGLVVLPIHPNQLKAARPRFRASGGKSDSFDAFCLAALVVDASEAALRGRGYPARLTGAGIAAPLVIFMLAASGARVQALLPENPVGGLFEPHRVTSQEDKMVGWMAENIPEGEHILVVSETSINAAQAKYLKFLDGGRHEWTRLHLDQGICKPRPNVQIRCDPEKNDISRIPPDAIWVQQMTSKMGACKFMSLSMSNLLEQVRREGSDYVMIAGPHEPRYAKLPLPLLASRAFEIAHAESGRIRRVVLLERTGLAPKVLPTQMNAKTVRSLKRCEQAQAPGSAEGIRSRFPNGIIKVSD